MITTRTKRIGILAGMCFLVLLTVFVLSFMYIRSQGNALQEQAAAISAHLERKQAYFSLEQVVAKTVQEREELAGYILAESGTIDFLAQIENDAKSVGVELKTDTLTVNPVAAPPAKGAKKASTTKAVAPKAFDVLAVSFSVTGSKNGVETLIQMLETLPYYSYVNRLSMGVTTEGLVTASIELIVDLKKI